MNDQNLSRPVADDVIAVLEEILDNFHPSHAEPDVPRAAKEGDSRGRADRVRCQTVREYVISAEFDT